MTARIFGGLNPEQARAAQHVDGPLLIFAGAGSGKTRVIVHRVAFLINYGVSPSKILCLTFTNKAALEMKLRLQKLLGKGDIQVWAGTFHAFGAWFLRHEAHRIDYPSAFAIYDEADQRSLIGKCMKELGITHEKGKDGRIAWLINMSKDTVRDISEIPLDLNFDPMPVIRLYEQRKKASGAFDFADLISIPYTMLSTMPDLKEKYQVRFPYILVDEYQDTNMAQYKLPWNSWEGMRTSAWWGTTTSPSTDGGGRMWAISCASRTTFPRLRSSPWSRITAPPKIS